MKLKFVILIAIVALFLVWSSQAKSDKSTAKGQESGQEFKGKVEKAGKTKKLSKLLKEFLDSKLESQSTNKEQTFESKQAETKQAESKQAETKQAETKQAETKQAESKQAETKQAETKQAVESKQAETKQAETKSFEAKQTAEPKQQAAAKGKSLKTKALKKALKIKRAKKIKKAMFKKAQQELDALQNYVEQDQSSRKTKGTGIASIPSEGQHYEGSTIDIIQPIEEFLSHVKKVLKTAKDSTNDPDTQEADPLDRLHDFYKLLKYKSENREEMTAEDWNNFKDILSDILQEAKFNYEDKRYDHVRETLRTANSGIQDIYDHTRKPGEASGPERLNDALSRIQHHIINWSNEDNISPAIDKIMDNLSSVSEGLKEYMESLESARPN